MRELAILVVEDEPEVREAIMRDLREFADDFLIEAAEDVDDAKDVLGQLAESGAAVGLILCDHLLPGERGVDFLIDLNDDPATAPIRKVLVTGQAGLEDTVRAVNEANLDHYIAKPWTPEQLHEVVRDQLTDFVIDEWDDLLAYVSVLDGARLMAVIAERGHDR